jgi:hypothetical protein
VIRQPDRQPETALVGVPAVMADTRNLAMKHAGIGVGDVGRRSRAFAVRDSDLSALPEGYTRPRRGCGKTPVRTCPMCPRTNAAMAAGFRDATRSATQQGSCWRRLGRASWQWRSVT